LSGDTVNDQPDGELSTWSIERLETRTRSTGAPEGPALLARLRDRLLDLVEATV
jgi:hypothetical protein